MSVVLWPRQEVLQLVLPQLGSVGRNLNANTAINLVKKLAKSQCPEGKLSFDSWLIAAKESLHWNDHCIHLFWDTLSFATCYLYRDTTLLGSREESSIDLEHLAIFLILHISDNTTLPHTSKSPQKGYDTMWPALAVNEDESTAQPEPVSPQNSPKKEHPSMAQLPARSPRSPKVTSPVAGNAHSPSISSGSPSNKRAHSNAARMQRSTAQYLHSVKQKLPVILRALSTDSDDPKEELSLSMDAGEDDSMENLLTSRNPEFRVTQKTLDALGLVICGGYSRDQSISRLSALHPMWGSEGDHHAQMLASRDSQDVHDASSVVPFSELSDWLNIHMSMNDVLYPVSAPPGFASIPGSPARDIQGSTGLESDVTGGMDASTGSPKAQQPQRVFSSVMALSRSTPTVINGCSTTIIHSVNAGSSRTSSFRKNSRSSMGLSSQSYDRMDTSNSYKHQSGLGIDSTDSADALEGVYLANRSNSMSPQNSFTGMTGMALSPNSSHHGLFGSSSSGHNNGSNSTSPTRHRLASGASDNSMEGAVAQNHGTDDLTKYTEHLELSRQIEQESRHNMADMGMANVAGTGSTVAKQDHCLPQLFINFSVKARLYLISPYYSASINACSDCDIMIGAVYGAVVISNCEKMRITCTCRKLIISNCMDCVFNIATLSTTIISGDSKGITIGPYNCAYRNLKNHLKLAALQPLLSTVEPSANAPALPTETSKSAAATIDIGRAQTAETSTNEQSPIEVVASGTGSAEDGVSVDGNLSNRSPNCWTSLCDVNACLEAAANTASPSGYAIDAAEELDVPLLPPLPSTARLLHYDDFRPSTVPFKAEATAFQNCALRTPTEYMESLEQQQETLVEIKSRLSAVIASTVAGSSSSSSSSIPTAAIIDSESCVTQSSSNATEATSEEKRQKQLTAAASTIISKKFMEWLVSSGNAKQVLDLVRLDGEKFGSSHQSHQSHHHQPHVHQHHTTST